MTLRLLHEEYLGQNADGYGYTQFCEHYRDYCRRRAVTMRQAHRAGDKLLIDYSGKRPSLTDPKTGEVYEVELFVAVCGASNYTYAEATLTQRVPDFIASHVRALEFIGGVPAALVPDQLKSAVIRACRYEPGPQRSYEELAQHYDTVVMPARPGKPRDKAKVEVAVQIAQRWILARLRHRVFFSLAELNDAIREQVDDLNDRVMRRYGESRRQLFERIERPALKPLPAERFSIGEWKVAAAVNIDYHVDVDGHFYSAPYRLVKERVDARLTATTVELYHRGARVAAHVRSYVRGGFTTLDEHMPSAHRHHAKWTPERMATWAATIGPITRRLVETMLSERRHPEQRYRSCLGLMRLGGRFGAERVEAACQRALVVGAHSYQSVKSILERGLDRAPLPEADAATPPGATHDNIRGPESYN